MKHKIYIIRAIILLILLLILLFLQKYSSNVEGFSEKRTAIIVEPRKHKALSFVLDNFASNLDESWDIVILHGTQNKSFVEKIVNTTLKKNKHRITLHNLNVENLTLEDYNNLLTSKDFYSYINTETFLVFQTDTVICEEYKDDINKFLQYDYVGAPNENWVGNGGLSLRKKSKMLEILNKHKRPADMNEDVFFTKYGEHLNIPDINTAKSFSTEVLYNENSFGVHKPWLYLNKSEMDSKQSKCKALKKLVMLNH